nr:hypothetical protein Iba_chr11bCG12870 [Ipomoea batatas]
MYPYLDFFNEQENQEMEYAADPEVDDQDLRSHLNDRMGSDRTHPVEPPPQDPGTPQYYPTPYQFPPGIFPQPAYFSVLETPPNPMHPELRRAQSERRPSGPYHDPSGPSRAPLPTQTEAVEAAENKSPRRRSAFDRLRRSARDRLGRRGVISGRRIGEGHRTRGRHRIGHHAHHGSEVLLVQGLLKGLPHGLLHLVPTFRMSPRAVTPSELFPDLLMDERSEEGLRFPGISAQETGEVGIARHLFIHLGSFPLCCLDLELRTRDPGFQCLYLLGQFFILRRQTLTQGDDVLAHHILRGLGSAEKVVRHGGSPRPLGRPLSPSPAETRVGRPEVPPQMRFLSSSLEGSVLPLAPEGRLWVEVGSSYTLGRSEDPILVGLRRDLDDRILQRPGRRGWNELLPGGSRWLRRRKVERVRYRNRPHGGRPGRELGQKGLARSGRVLRRDDPRRFPVPRAVFAHPTVVRPDLVSRSGRVCRGRIHWSGLYDIVVILGRDVLAV